MKYSPRDMAALEPHYSAHVAAMTEEELHAKSDIAAELAFRDAEIVRLRTELSALREAHAIDDLTIADHERNRGWAES